MKKSIYSHVFIACLGLYGCITSDRTFHPIYTTCTEDLKLVNYPANSNNYILGVGYGVGYAKDDVSFVVRDCFSNEYISCTDSTGNMKDYIILFLGESDEEDYRGGANDLFKEDGNEYYVKIYLAQHKKIDYAEQQSKSLNYLDTIEVDIDDYYVLQEIVYYNDGQKIWYKGRKIPSCRLLSFKIRK